MSIIIMNHTKRKKVKSADGILYRDIESDLTKKEWWILGLLCIGLPILIFAIFAILN